MALFGGKTPPPSVGELIARKRYTEAIEELRARLVVQRNSGPLRLQLADVLVLAGRGAEAIPILIRLADEFAAEGLVARSMAILKRVQKIDPKRLDIDVRISGLLRPKGAPASEEPSAAGIKESAEKYEPSFMFDFGDAPAPVGGSAPPVAPAADARPPEAVPSEEEERAAEAYLRKELLDTIHHVLKEPTPPRPPRAKVRSPLFESLSEDEMVALFKELRLLTFEPGDLILMQGDEGDRMFVIASGRCKTFLKEPGGRRRIFTGTLEEGAFFGEISLLRGEPRHDTVIAATHLELLELERTLLENLCRSHPRVRGLLEDLSQQRLVSEAEAVARRERHGTAGPASE